MCPGGGGSANTLGRCSSCHRQPLLLRSHPRGSDLVASISPPLESLRGPVASLHGRDHLLLSFPRCYPGPALLATGRIRSRSCQRSPAPLLLRHLTLPRVPYCPTASWNRERARRAPGSLSLQKRDVPSRPGSCTRGRRPSWATVVPELAPNPRPPKFAALLFRGGGSAPWGGRWLGL